MIVITVRSRGGYKRRLCNAHNDIDAKVELRRSHPLGYERGAKFKSYERMKIGAEVFNGQQSELLSTPGIEPKEPIRGRGV